MRNDPQVLAELIGNHEKARMYMDLSTQYGKCANAGMLATIKALQSRMTQDELIEACDIMARPKG